MAEEKYNLPPGGPSIYRQRLRAKADREQLLGRAKGLFRTARARSGKGPRGEVLQKIADVILTNPMLRGTLLAYAQAEYPMLVGGLTALLNKATNAAPPPAQAAGGPRRPRNLRSRLARKLDPERAAQADAEALHAPPPPPPSPLVYQPTDRAPVPDPVGNVWIPVIGKANATPSSAEVRPAPQAPPSVQVNGVQPKAVKSSKRTAAEPTVDQQAGPVPGADALPPAGTPGGDLT